MLTFLHILSNYLFLFMPWQCCSMHGQPVYDGSVEFVHIGFHGLHWWGRLTRSLPQESTKSHYRWLWATMWLLGIEFRTSVIIVSALNCWAISLAHFYLMISQKFKYLPLSVDENNYMYVKFIIILVILQIIVPGIWVVDPNMEIDFLCFCC